VARWRKRSCIIRVLDPARITRQPSGSAWSSHFCNWLGNDASTKHYVYQTSFTTPEVSLDFLFQVHPHVGVQAVGLDRDPARGARSFEPCSKHMLYCLCCRGHEGDERMSRAKMVYVSEQAHRRLRLLAARRNRPMGRVVEELVEEELTDLVNPWAGPEGLMLQQEVLAAVWDDPALDVYNDD